MDAGGASSGDLLRALQHADALPGCGFHAPPDNGVFDLVDAIDPRRGYDWVRKVVAAEVEDHSVSPEPRLRVKQRVFLPRERDEVALTFACAP